MGERSTVPSYLSRGKTLNLITKRGLEAKEGEGTPMNKYRSKSIRICGPGNGEPWSGKNESQREERAKQWNGWSNVPWSLL